MQEKPHTIAPEADVIPVRKGEELDTEALRAYLQGKLKGSEAPLTIEQFAGGHANLTYLLHFGEYEYVLRRPPKGDIAATAHDMGREFKVLSVLYKVFPPAPRALLFCNDSSVIGAPFFIMERKRGTVVRQVIPPAFGGGNDPEVNRRISEVLIDTLVQLHAADYRSVGLADLGRPQGYMERQVRGWTERYERAKTKEIDVVKELTEWLKQKLPVSPPATLVHNDWRLDNIMLDAHDPGRVVAVFDWDMCTIGDPLADLGCLLSLWFEQGESIGLGVMPTQTPGFLTRAEAVQRYAFKSGRDVHNIAYYHTFGLFKMAVIVQQIFYRFHKGQTQDQRFRYFDVLAEMLISLAWTTASTSSL